MESDCQVLDPGGAGQLGKGTQEAQPTEVLRSEQVLLMRRGKQPDTGETKGEDLVDNKAKDNKAE